MLYTKLQIRKDRLKELSKEYFHKYNVIRGVVHDYNKDGCYVIDDESGEEVFYYGNGMKGDRVELTIKKVDLERVRVTCLLNSVLEYGEFVA